ncbi:MAG: SGNH/GDSL hydrolase family protein, partial [Pirellulaceae bacterium]|nr:SGNH/GDSL hydrolase family protein [Pirellulaceae bacterium]
TDMLADQNRGPKGSRRHFSALGQRNAAAMWFSVLLSHLQQPRPAHEAVLESLADMHLLAPAWSSPIVYRESSVLLQMEKDGPIESRLAFPATEILTIASADGQSKFELGRDCTLSSDKLKLIWNSPTKIEPITASQMFPPKDAPNSYRHRASNPEQNMFYAPGKFFHEHNVEVTYRRSDRTNQASESLSATSSAERSRGLSQTLAKLRAKQSVRIGVSGDSISTGLDASGTTRTVPNQPGYAELVAAQLTHSYGSPIQLDNRSVSGWSIAQGVKDLDALLVGQPDLLIVAYGMNDVGRRDPQWFADQAKLLEEQARQKLPAVEIIWVAPMLGHQEWVHTPREMFAKYRDELSRRVGPQTCLADLTEVWSTMLQHKHDFDLTGNGLNHPNDFGHRLYAQCLLQLLIETE